MRGRGTFSRPLSLRLAAAVWLVVVWVALWGRFSAANLASGALVALVLLRLFPLRTSGRQGRFRPWSVVRLAAYFVVKLVEANMVVAWEVLTPSNRINEGIVAVPVLGASEVLTTVVANAISLTPGTLTIEVRPEERMLYVHVLHLHSIEAVHLEVARLELHVLRAFGTDEAVTAMERRLATLEQAGHATLRRSR